MKIIDAIPTEHGGVKFRSRLEAKWASFFDLCGWRWEYEPEYLDGWLPDFKLHGADWPIYVEVKPINWFGDEEAMQSHCAERDDLQKVMRNLNRFPRKEDFEPTAELLILGNGPAVKGDGNVGVAYLGVFVEEAWGNGMDAAVLWAGKGGRAFDFCGQYGSFHYRMGGEGDGDRHLTRTSTQRVRAAWKFASAQVEWPALKGQVGWT